MFRSTFLGHQLLEVFLEFNRELPVVLGGGGLVKRITVPKSVRTRGEVQALSHFRRGNGIDSEL